MTSNRRLYPISRLSRAYLFYQAKSAIGVNFGCGFYSTYQSFDLASIIQLKDPSNQKNLFYPDVPETMTSIHPQSPQP
ncbi:MAG: hypothetical protein ACI814_004549 [Mariniblastus sp.]|jgi:hypothetical protein